MRILRWLAGAALFIGALLFALQNTDLVTVRLYYLFSWQTPLIVLLLIAFGAGVVAGVAAGFARFARLRRQLERLRRLPRRARPAEPPPAPGA
jgi:uncharacterized integral membrane protein